MNELKPCPFCGGEAEIYNSCDKPPYYRVEHYCFCDDFRRRIRIRTDWKATPEQAAELWNERS